MLQNPSKYHPNPLSHFLALHNSQAAHDVSSHPTLPTTSTGHHPFQQEHLQSQHPYHGTMTNHHSHHHQQLKTTHSHLMDANTSLDAGKSFTIAAILGLQKSAIENNRKDYNVINLSLNNNNNNNNQHSTQNHHIFVKGEHFLTKHTTNNNNNNSNSNNISAGIQNFNCDTSATTTLNGGGASSLACRYLPTANVNSSATSFSVAAASHQQQSSNTTAHLRANSFAAAVAAAANMTGGAPTALQSLQQLHQHHTQQSSLNFQRDKLKADNHSKKSSLKNKRVRTIFTPEQLERLEAEFERQQYMVGPERLYLAHTLQLTEAQVKVWFQNRRIKWRKHHLEITQQRLALLRQSQISTTTTVADPPNPRTTTATPSCDETEDLNNTNSLREMGESSRQASESDLSICNDSNDVDSYIDGDDT